MFPRRVFARLAVIAHLACLATSMVLLLLRVSLVSAAPAAISSPVIHEIFGLENEDRISWTVASPDLRKLTDVQMGLDLPEIDPLTLPPRECIVIKADVDLDGDLDLIALTPKPRLLVWINDGRGKYFPARPIRSAFVRHDPVGGESAENDFLPLWLDPNEFLVECFVEESLHASALVTSPRSANYFPRCSRAPPG